MSDVSITDPTMEDYSAIQELCDARYGTGYLTPDAYADWMTRPALFRVARIEGAFAGFAVMVPASVETVMKKMGMPREDVLSFAKNRPILIYKSAAVLPTFHGKKLGKRLTEAAISAGEQAGYGSVFGSAWVCGSFVPMAETFLALGFTQLYRRQMLWYEDKDYCCAYCHGRCLCDAMIFCKTIGGTR